MVWDRVATKFWARVERGTPTECWRWTARRNANGYGTLKVNGRQWLAHRVAWALTVGTDPGPLLVCHHCDNPGCVNPAHLFVGTASDNAQDMVRKGRAHLQKHPELSPYTLYPGSRPKGERNGRARVTEAVVTEIRAMRAGGMSQAAIGRKVGLSQQQISHIVRGVCWA